jgi:hypothetical protein
LTLYELGSDGTATARGTLLSASGVVAMADNGVELILVDGTTAGYLLTLSTNVFAPIVSAAFYGADRVAFFDGYFVLNRPGTQQIYISGLYAGGVYDGTDFASDESSPDTIVSLEVQRRELLVLGSRSGQLWFDAGAVDFPFAPIAGTAFTYGCAAPHSLRTLGGEFYWLTSSTEGMKSIVKLEGYQPVAISTPAVEFALNGYASVADAIGCVYQEEGHSFYGLNFPSGNATWVYDSTTKFWHERADLNADTGLFQRSRIEHHCFAFDHHRVAGSNDGRVYTQSLEVFDLAGDALVLSLIHI